MAAFWPVGGLQTRGNATDGLPIPVQERYTMIMATQPTLDERIETTPGVCGGKPRIAGHRVRVQDIAAWHELQGMSADEIVAGYPQLSLADVYAALAYYHVHRDEIQQQMKADEEFVENLRQAQH
jgi:uncharacterized protein (DUF433 family)